MVNIMNITDLSFSSAMQILQEKLQFADITILGNFSDHVNSKPPPKGPFMSGCHFHLLWLSSASGHQGEMISLPVRITPWLCAEICSAGGAGRHRKEFWHITAELMWVGGWGVWGFVSLESIRFFICSVCYSCSYRQCQGRMTLVTAMFHLQSPGLLLPVWFCYSLYQISDQKILVLCERIFSTGFIADSFYQPVLMEWHKWHPNSKNILDVMSRF